MNEGNSQAFIKRNRPPRVQIGIDIDNPDAQKKTEIPMVIGVMAGLSGKSKKLIPISDREFEPCNNETELDQRMKSIQPRVAFDVNAPKGEGKLSVDLTFEKMEDFQPIHIAQKIDGIKELYALRQTLSALAGRTDGKRRTEEWLTQTLDEIKRKLAQSPEQNA